MVSLAKISQPSTPFSMAQNRLKVEPMILLLALLLCCLPAAEAFRGGLSARSRNLRPHHGPLQAVPRSTPSLGVHGKGKPSYGPAGRIRTAYSASPLEKIRSFVRRFLQIFVSVLRSPQGLLQKGLLAIKSSAACVSSALKGAIPGSVPASAPSVSASAAASASVPVPVPAPAKKKISLDRDLEARKYGTNDSSLACPQAS